MLNIKLTVWSRVPVCHCHPGTQAAAAAKMAVVMAKPAPATVVAHQPPEGSTDIIYISKLEEGVSDITPDVREKLQSEVSLLLLCTSLLQKQSVVSQLQWLMPALYRGLSYKLCGLPPLCYLQCMACILLVFQLADVQTGEAGQTGSSKVIEIRQCHLVKAVEGMGPSVSAGERLRYQKM